MPKMRLVTHGPRGSCNELGPEGGTAVAGALTALTGLLTLDMRCEQLILYLVSVGT